jgi:hypothetical protein
VVEPHGIYTLNLDSVIFAAAAAAAAAVSTFYVLWKAHVSSTVVEPHGI